MPAPAALPSDESARLATLRGLGILDTPPEPAFDSLARLAAHVCRTPIALVSLVDENRQWFKARVGLEVTETPRDVAFCAHAILQSPMLEVCDAPADARFAENPLVTGDPRIRFYAGVPIRTRDGHALGTVCVIDIVPRRLDDDQRWVLRALADQAAAQIELQRSAKEAAAALRVLDEERVLLRGVLDASTDYAIVATSVGGTITVFNRGAEKLFGYRADEVIGRTTTELCPAAAGRVEPGAPPRVSTGFERSTAAARRGEIDRHERICVRKDGRRFPAAVTITPMRNESNEITGFIEITRNLTEERRAERERQRVADEAIARAHAYEVEAAAHRAADAANHAKDEFIAVLSHELRTPLTAVIGWAQLLQMPQSDRAPPLDEPAHLARGLRVIENNANALLRFVESILEVNRIVAGNLALSCESVEVGEVVQETVEALKLSAVARGLTLTLTVDPGLAPIMADRARLGQIVVNLITNAVKFTPRGGRIDVRLDHLDDQLRLSVCDTGEGISREFLPHMFERFVQADSTRTRAHGGLGIGLAIVRHLVELHGGTVTAKSAGRDQGAEITVLLPITTPPPDEPGVLTGA